MTNLELVLAGRDERAAVQNELLATAAFVCQISLNIPGWPKRLDGDEAAARKCAGEFQKQLGRAPLTVRELASGAGFCIEMSFDGDADDAKRAAVEIEETAPWGRVFDIDVITRDGQLSRKTLGLPARKCLLCNEEAKVCARAGRHSQVELRKVLSLLIDKALSS